jgi:hypothetical protein
MEEMQKQQNSGTFVMLTLLSLIADWEGRYMAVRQQLAEEKAERAQIAGNLRQVSICAPWHQSYVFDRRTRAWLVRSAS